MAVSLWPEVDELLLVLLLDGGSFLVSVSESLMSVPCVAADVLRECCVVCVCVE